MNRHIETIMELTGCSEDDAMRVYAETNDVEDAVDKILPPSKNSAKKYYEKLKPVRTYTEEETAIKKLREEMKKFDKFQEERAATLSRQPGGAAPGESCILPAETAQQSSCYQECQLPVQGSAAETPGTACQ